jgi:dihydrodipicolinate reductase
VVKKESEDDRALGHAAIRATDHEVLLGQHIKDPEFQETPEEEVSPAVVIEVSTDGTVLVTVEVVVEAEAAVVVSSTAVHEDDLTADHRLARLNAPTTETFKIIQHDHQFLNSYHQITSLLSLRRVTSP